ncbi:MAG TPA: carboxypeptidase-like regulatory domain-containing protein [Terracidiphilus sp.]|nr:carboxypeptidase-like regulatory domain-containing protein [Terracidiphilus sp.]
MQSLTARLRQLGGCACVSALLFTPCLVKAQIAGTGNIQGTVADSSGAVIPNATVTLTDEATHVKRTTQTSGAGVYLFPGVPVGTYDLSATATGFKSYVQTKIVLEVGSSIAVNPALTVGSREQTVEVQAEGLALQTEDPTFKQTIDSNEVTEMPLNGRQMTNLITLSGGSNSAPGGDFTGSKYSYQTISVSIAGGGGNTTLWRLDGGDNQDYMANGNLPYPFPDAVSQFSVESTALGAQDGGHVGGMVNVVTRSGTNTFHGSAFEFIRNNYIDATNFFSTSPDQLHQNQFGGTFGGPIIRNKLFGFAAYQRTVAYQKQASKQATVPTADNMLGDFSASDGDPAIPSSNNCASNKAPIPLVDPLTGATLQNNKYVSAPTYNAQSLNLQKYFPKIDSSYDKYNCGYVSYAIPLNTFDNQFVTRVDYTISSKQNLYGRYFIDGYQQPAFFFPNNIFVTTQSGNIERVQSFVLGDAYTISPNVVNAAHITILRRVDNRGYNASDINAATLGVNLYQAAKAGLQISEGKFTIGGGTNSLSHFNDNTLAVGDDVTWVRGKHQLMFGGEWVQNQLNIGNIYEGNGNFGFNGQYSGSGPGGGSKIGDQTLDFLMGTLSSFEQSKQQQNALRGPIPSLYFQDTYHVSPQMTIVAGLRWNPNFMPHDYFNRGLVFNQADFLSNTASTVYPNAPAGILYYGDKGVSRQFTKNSPWQFAPNLGVSFDPSGNGKTVIRAGGALQFDNPNFFTAQRNQQNPPYATAIANSQTSSSGPLSFSAPWSTGAITTSPFPQPAVPGPTQTFAPQSQYIFMVQQFHAAYTIQWTLSVQRQFGHGWQAQLDYIGNATRHDPIGFGVSPAVFIPGEWGANGTGCTGIVTTGPAAVKPGAAGTDCSTTGNQTSRFLLTTKNPNQGNQFKGGGGGSVLVADTSNASYNGLVATIQHRLSSTFSLLGNWTWAKCLNIDDASGDYAGTSVENINNPGADYGPCGSDYRHIENASLVARSNFHGMNRLLGLVVNNWEFAPLMHISSGGPVNVTSGQDNSLTDVGNDRPNLVSGANAYHEAKFRSGTSAADREYLNPASFAQVTAPCPVDPNTKKLLPGCQYLGTYGNISRNAFRGPKAFDLDAQISRIFPIRERFSLNLRLEAFNALNHPNFGNPDAKLTDSKFGQVSSASAARVFQGAVKVSF